MAIIIYVEKFKRINLVICAPKLIIFSIIFLEKILTKNLLGEIIKNE